MEEAEKEVKMEMFCVYHNYYDLREDNNYFTFFGTNEIYDKTHDKNKVNRVILEYELDIYNPFLQKRGYMETSVYLHVYWNKLYKNKNMIGFSQYDTVHYTKYDNLDKDTIYLLNTTLNIVTPENEWNMFMFADKRNLDFVMNSYNTFFGKKYTKNDLKNIPLSLLQTNIYPVKIYEKLCSWLEVFVNEIYPWSNEPPYETHFGSIGGYTERVLSIFNAIQIYEGVSYEYLNLYHGKEAEMNKDMRKEQYNPKSFINSYCQDIHTKYISNITTAHDDVNVNYSMFKSQCYLNGMTYSCERVNKGKSNGLCFKKTDCSGNVLYEFECAYNIGGEDPRMVILNNHVYVIFTCESNEPIMNRGIAITRFETYNPVLLKLRNSEMMNRVEKNWAPLVKDDTLYFVYNFDPLIVIKYDFNAHGYCDIVTIQNNIDMPIDVNTKYLRGGSNFIHLKDNYYIGGCHSRVHYNGIFYNTHMVILDTASWKVVYLSKPVMYYYNNNNNNLKLQTISNTTVLHHKSTLLNMSSDLHNIQAPCSLYKKNDKVFITVDINCHITLLYELIIDIPVEKYKSYEIGELEELVFLYNKIFIENTY